ncbi:MAG: hypothetical protein HY650_14455 [Acidobacteria bacterium]|nr:hypothetical protein [Acidobacteriota bacterium]
MRTKRRKTITIDTDREVVIRQYRNATKAWCNGCGRQTAMLAAKEAAALTGVTQRTTCRWVEAGRLHFTETSDGGLLICLKSMLKDERCMMNRGVEP